MEEDEFNLNLFERYILSPADIYWQKNSHSKIYISKKGDFINLNLMKKIIMNNKTLHVENSFDLKIHQEFKEYFDKFNSEDLVREKKLYRKKIIQLLLKNYYSGEKDQLDLTLMVTLIFSERNLDKFQVYLNRDRDYFRWTLKVTSAYTICIFLLGYYQVDFLRKSFLSTLENLNHIGKNELIGNFISKMGDLKNKTSLDESDRNYIIKIVGENNYQKLLTFEKMDGTGVIGLSSNEFIDLEILFISLIYFYDFAEDVDERNILNEISQGQFNVNKRIMNLIKRNFEYEKEEAEKVAS